MREKGVEGVYISTLFVSCRLTGRCREIIKELKQRRRLRTGRQRLLKNECIVYQQNSKLSRSVQHTNGSKNVLRLSMGQGTKESGG